MYKHFYLTYTQLMEVVRILDPYLYDVNHENIKEDDYSIGFYKNNRYVKMMKVNGSIFCSDNNNCNNPSLTDYLRGINFYNNGI